MMYHLLGSFLSRTSYVLGAQKNGLSEMVLLSTHYTITERLLIGS